MAVFSSFNPVLHSGYSSFGFGRSCNFEDIPDLQKKYPKDKFLRCELDFDSSIMDISGLNFALKFYPCGRHDAQPNFCSVFFESNICETDRILCVQWKFTILNGDVVKSVSDLHMNLYGKVQQFEGDDVAPGWGTVDFVDLGEGDDVQRLLVVGLDLKIFSLRYICLISI